MLYKKSNSKYWYTKFELTYQNKRNRINKSTRQTSKSKAEAFEAQLKQDLWQTFTHPTPAAHQFNEAVKLYIDSRQTNRTIKEKHTKLIWWSKHLNNPVLSELTTQAILTTISKKKDIAIATRNRYLAELKAFLNFCHAELGWLSQVPVLKILKEPRRSFFKLDQQDIKRLLHASPDYLKPVISFALMSGLRRSNIFKLRWSQIDFDNHCVYIAGADHKSKEHVNTPLSAQAIGLLRYLKVDSQSPFVFINTRNNRVAKISDQMWKKIIKSAQLDGLRFHDLRHNWATKHIEAGTDLLALKELGGWKTLEMVQRYAHPSTDYLAQQAKNIDPQNSQPQAPLTDEKNEESIANKELVTKEPKLFLGKKSSHLEVFEVNIGGYTLVLDAQKQKNLLFNSRLERWYRWADLNRHARKQRILNPSCIPISPHRHHIDVSKELGSIESQNYT